MEESKKSTPQVRVGHNDMEAFLLLPRPEGGEYTIEELQDALREKGVVYGVSEAVLRKMLEGRVYDKEIKVAQGSKVKEGIDGYFEYHFNRNLDGKPTIREDGTVDYWSINRIEMVEENQLIATYHPAVMGMDGMDVKGKPITVKRARELPPLKGKGFTRSEDNLTYYAKFDGKIEVMNDRLMVLQVYEIAGNVDLTVGNIDFNGDVIVHGNVCAGVNIKAAGNITIDGIVETASLWAGKDIILRGGIMGDSKSSVYAKGSISGRFFEYAKVEAEGEIQAEVFMNSEVVCKKKITLSGRKASIIGGSVWAVQGIEAGNLGNESEISTEVSVGNSVEVQREVWELEKKVQEAEEGMVSLENRLKEFTKLEAANAIKKDDPRKVQLLRVKIQEVAKLGALRGELDKLNTQIQDGQNAIIKVLGTSHPGVRVLVDDARYHVKSKEVHVEYKKEKEEVSRNFVF